MLEPKDIKDVLQKNGLVQNDLFDWGYYKRSTALTAPLTLLSVLTLSPMDASATSSVFGFTLVDGKLIITPVKKDMVLVDDAVFVTKEDVREVKIRTSSLGDGILVIRYKNGKKKEYHIGEISETIKKMVDMFNS